MNEGNLKGVYKKSKKKEKRRKERKNNGQLQSKLPIISNLSLCLSHLWPLQFIPSGNFLNDALILLSVLKSFSVGYHYVNYAGGDYMNFNKFFMNNLFYSCRSGNQVEGNPEVASGDETVC